MPNWAEGNIRLRGTPDQIVEFLQNELLYVGTGHDFETVEVAPDVHWGEFLDVRLPKEAKEQAKFTGCLYVKGTRRNFIDGISGKYLPKTKEQFILCLNNFRAAWYVNAEPYVEKSKKYGIDIRIVVNEMGMEFGQRIEIIKGELVMDEERKYQNWWWDADFPEMGG